MSMCVATPILSCAGAAEAIAFYERAFGAVERERYVGPDGRVGHATLEIEGVPIALADEYPEIEFRSPRSRGGSTVFIHLSVTDADALLARAHAAGAHVLEQVREAHGERRGKVQDPWGHVWLLATPVSCADAGASSVGRLWELLDLITPLAIRVAATLRLADHIQAGRDRVSDLAAAVHADPGALGRVLRYLAVRGVFADSEPGRFALNELGSVLLSGHASGTRAWADLEGFGGKMDLAFFDLLPTIRAGHPSVRVHEADLSDEISAGFDDLMEAESLRQSPGIVAAFDWPQGAHVMDVGGGTGSLLIALLRSRPDIHATLVELPRTAERARLCVADAGMEDRCAVLAGNLFETALPVADVTILKFLLHGMDDDTAVAALVRCREAGGPSSRIVVVERSLEPGQDARGFASMDLRMLILGEGRERTVDEYAALSARAGLRLTSVARTAAGLHVLEFREPS